jgi:hypothetical protein
MPRVEPSTLAGRVRREDGQTFVFVLTMLFALLLLVATSINIGQAVNRRILVQMLADAGAFTGATEMARGMNTIAEQNGRIQNAWMIMVGATHFFTDPPCRANDEATGAYGRARAALGRVIEALDAGYGRRAEDEARRVTEYSAIDLFPGERLAMGESLPGLRPQRPAGRVVELEQVPDGTKPETLLLEALDVRHRGAFESAAGFGGFSHRVWGCRSSEGLLPREASFDLWYRAVADSTPVAFVWVVTAPARQARLFDRFFGPDAIPEMSAAAVAKPIGGEIKRARAFYVTKMVPLRELLPRVADNVRQRWRDVYH